MPFSNKDLRAMIVPLFLEQLLVMLVGIADTLVVSYAGEAAVSGVSLVNQCNTIFIYLFTALASGGAVVISQYIGRRERENAGYSASQLLMFGIVFSLLVAALVLAGSEGMLQLLFGKAEDSVMDACVTYLKISVYSYPALAIYNSGAAVYRSLGKTNVPAAKAPELSAGKLTISVGESKKLKVTNGKNVKWSSSKKTVATVSQNGTVKAKKAGKTTITARVSNKKLKCVVTVKAADPANQVVILYFSVTGTTKGVAERIETATGGQLIEITPKEPYTDADLDYNNSNSRAYKEHNSANSNAESKVRPEVSNMTTIQNAVKIAEVVYIGYPIWWGEAPHIVFNVVENIDLKGKTVVPFCTSASSGMGSSGRELKSKANISGETNWLSGHSFYDIPSQKTVDDWIKKLDL